VIGQDTVVNLIDPEANEAKVNADALIERARARAAAKQARLDDFHGNAPTPYDREKDDA
jgi:hypothetical protein